MAVRARQFQTYVEQPTVVQRQQKTTIKQAKKKRITAKEKLLYFAFIVVVAIMAVTVLHKQSSIQQSTIEIQQINSEISEISKENVDLKVKVGELSRYDRIMEKAKALGFTLNEKNVKVVPGE